MSDIQRASIIRDQLDYVLVNAFLSANDEQEVHKLISGLRIYIAALEPKAVRAMPDVEAIAQEVEHKRNLSACIHKAEILLERLQAQVDLDKVIVTSTDKIADTNALTNYLPAHQMETMHDNLGMVPTAIILKQVEIMQPVGQISIPQVVNGHVTEQIPTGTGWQVAPGLAFTCWHVIKARGAYDQEFISHTDLQSQVMNSVLTFDYTMPGQGIEYRIAALESYDPELDYALLRLEDRADNPLIKRGFLKLDVDAPVTLQTILYVIQHPKRQPQQNSSGRFVKFKDDLHTRIFYNAPTEYGTSGAPVLNQTNWRVIALHQGEDIERQLRIATLLKPILSHVHQERPDIYKEIVNIS